MERENGYYWVKYKGEWTIGELDKLYPGWPWIVMGGIGMYKDEDFDEIGSKIEREEREGETCQRK